MGYIVLTLIAGIIGIGCIIVGTAFASGAKTEGEKDGGNIARFIVAPAIFVLWLIITIVSSAHSVDAGEVGIVRQFGNIVGQRDSGLQWTLPWQSLDTVDIKAQRFSNAQAKDGELPPAYVAFSKETQDSFMRITLVYHVDKGDVQTLVRNAGTDYFQRLGIEARLLTTLKEETVKYLAVDIAPNRETIRNAVKEKLSLQLNALSIKVDDFLIDNIDFSDQFKQAIEDKQKATQSAQAAQNVVEQRKAEAEQLRQQAQGKADAAVIEANGQAEANATLAKSLTPALLQYSAIQKLGDNVQIALIPSGQGIIIDPSTLLTPVK